MTGKQRRRLNNLRLKRKQSRMRRKHVKDMAVEFQQSIEAFLLFDVKPSDSGDKLLRTMHGLIPYIRSLSIEEEHLD